MPQPIVRVTIGCSEDPVRTDVVKSAECGTSVPKWNTWTSVSYLPESTGCEYGSDFITHLCKLG